MIKNIILIFLFFAFANTASAKQIKITSDKLEIFDSPFDIAAKIRALCDNDLSPGNVNVPLIDILF